MLLMCHMKTPMYLPSFLSQKKGIRLYLKLEEKKQDHTSGITIEHITFYESRSTNSYYMHT